MRTRAIAIADWFADRFDSRGRGRHHPWYRRITRAQVGFAVVAGLAALGLLFGLQAARANSALRLAANQAEVLQNQIVSGDDVSAKASLGALQDSTARAKDATAGTLWDVGAKVPYFGRNVAAIQTVSEVLDQVATGALPPVVALSKQVNLNTFSPKKGRVDLAAIREIAPPVAAADRALTAAKAKLTDIDPGSLLVPLRGPVGTIKYKVDTAQSAAAASDLAARLLPPMLGAKDTRRYLLLIQNNAEVRSTGGISGSFAILKAKKGKLSMGTQGSIQDLLPSDKPVVPMTAEESTVYSTSLVRDLRDANLTPDFPRTGVITQALVKKGLDVTVDGVISVDPIALSAILGGTGAVTLVDGTILDQSNAVSVLLNGIYRKYEDNDVQDELFQSAARKIFNAVKAGRGESRLVISGMVSAANENRLLVWSSHTAEQRKIATTGLSGELTGDDGATPHIGMYLSDAAGGKMEYYLDYTTVVTAGRCLPGDIQELSTSTDLTSLAPGNARKLSRSVTGRGTLTPRGTMRLIVRFYSPYEGGFTEVRVNGKRQTVYADRHLGRNVTKVVLSIKPGQTYTVTTSMISGRGQSNDAVFSTTPGVQSTRNDFRVPSACG